MQQSLPPGRRVLFVGDSITDAFRRPEEANESYRMGNGFAFMVVASLRDRYAPLDWTFENRGVAGETLKMIERHWAEDFGEAPLHWLSCLIGVNEVIRRHWEEPERSEPPEFEERYRAMLGRARERHPGLRLVLAEPFLVRVGIVTAEWQEWLRPYQAVVRQLAEEPDAVFLPLQSVFDRACETAPPDYWAFDGIHPTPAGFRRIAQCWLDRVEPELSR